MHTICLAEADLALCIGAKEEIEFEVDTDTLSWKSHLYRKSGEEEER